MSLRYRLELDNYEISQLEGLLLSEMQACEAEAEASQITANPKTRELLIKLYTERAERMDALLGKLGEVKEVMAASR